MPAARRLGALEITLIVIDVVLVGVLVFLLVTAPRGAEDPGADDSSSSTEQLSEGTGEEETSPTSTQAVTAPDDALDLAEFRTPSGNIWCTIGDASAICQINEIDYQPPQIDGCADNDLAGKVIQVTAEGAEYPCPEGDISGAAPGDRPELAYEPAEQTTAVGDFMCTSTRNGVTCTNLSTGTRFTISRSGPSID